MKKFTKIIAAATAVLLTLGAAGCKKTTNYPDFINPTDVTDEPNETTEKYIVNVRSEGGLPLDGVRVSAKKNGTVIRRGISKEGKIELGVVLDEYELEIDAESLPAGYYLPSATYKTNPSRRDEVNISIPSKLIEAGSAASSFAVGSIMRDFTFADTDGVYHKLSELLKQKRAVALNFFFTGCGPCRAEFPAINKAYQDNSNIELLAISHDSNGDDERAVAKFKEDNELSFPMGMDTIGLTSSFNVSGFPTTVIIDRYGLIAYRSSGTDTDESSWRRLFSRFTAANYTQSLTGNGDQSGNQGNISGALVKPDVSMPSSGAMNAAASADIQGVVYSEDENEYTWPWVTGTDADGGYICASNTGIGNSNSIVYIDIPMKEGEVLTFDYFLSSELLTSAGGDKFSVFIDGDAMNGAGWSGEIGWTSYDVYVADRDKTVQLAFAYIKDAADPQPEEGEEITCKDIAMVRNIRLADSSSIEDPLDVMRPCASGEAVGFKYSHYVNAVYNEADGFYHKDTADGAIIYITISNLATPWSKLRGSKITDASGSSVDATLFSMTAPYYNNDNLTCIVGDTDVYEAYATYVLIYGYMPEPFYLLPVTDNLKEWADVLIKEVAPADYTENSWLEFCYYYDHYGSEDFRHDGDETCKVNVDYTKGLTKYNAYEAHLGRQKAEIRFPLQLTRNGTYYKFTAETAGVYQIRSYTTGCSSSKVSPKLSIRDTEDNFILISGEIRDVDGLGNGDKDYTPAETYEGFNEYIRLNAGQTVYMYLECSLSETGYYDFEITNHGEDFSKMLICSTLGGGWIGSSTYAGIRVALNPEDNCYYATDRNGEINLDQPIYVDMLHESCLISENAGKKDYNYFPLKTLIDSNFFANYVTSDPNSQTTMERLLGEALDKDESDPLYGMVQATAEFAEIINKFYDNYLDGGRGDGRGWLAFCVYEEYFN